MTAEEAKQLRPGDEVFWRDPDDGACSRHITIARIRINDDIATIVDHRGGVLDCFLSELE